jgi:hypothetical protein
MYNFSTEDETQFKMLKELRQIYLNSYSESKQRDENYNLFTQIKIKILLIEFIMS